MFEGFTRYLLKELIGRVKAALKDGHFYSEKKKGVRISLSVPCTPYGRVEGISITASPNPQ
jgi:hypothetical protein